MRIDLGEKIALITGGASGIGRACASALSTAGASVVVADIDRAGALDTIHATGGIAVQCDMGDPKSVSAMREQVMAEAGGVDILVNCAGLIRYSNGVCGITADEWDVVLTVNLRGSFLVCRAFMNILKERRNGRIINLSSMAARVGGIDVGAHYTSSKAGLIGLTRSLAKEGGPFGITANALAPGITLTDPVKRHLSREHKQAYRKQVPLGRLGKPEDIAHAVLFLASPLANYVSGIVLDVNGGMHMA